MGNIDNALGLAVAELSDQNYAHSLAFYRLWFDIGQTYPQIPSDQISDTIWNNRRAGSINNEHGQLIHQTAHLITRLASDRESDLLLSPHTPGLQNRLSARSLGEFFSNNLVVVRGECGSPLYNFYTDANLIAHWANLGYVEEAAIRNHVLQSLISHSKLYDHQADALIVLFKLAGATFGAYADPQVVDRCFELLKGHSYTPPFPNNDPPPPIYYNANYTPPNPSYGQRCNNFHQVRRELVQVSSPRVVKCGNRTKVFQEVVTLRERGWEGLPPPPVFTTGKPKPTGSNQKDPAATPVATALGLPNRDLQPQIPRPPPPELATTSEPGIVLEPPVTPITQSPSISIATLSDFTIADASDDEPPTWPTFADNSDDEPLIDPRAVVPHETFYFEDGNAEVLCGATLFRIHTTILFLHSPALRQMFSQTNLATAESPNGCPRILSTDTAGDFVTLLKTIYLPGFVVLPTSAGCPTD